MIKIIDMCATLIVIVFIVFVSIWIFGQYMEQKEKEYERIILCIDECPEESAKCILKCRKSLEDE